MPKRGLEAGLGKATKTAAWRRGKSGNHRVFTGSYGYNGLWRSIQGKEARRRRAYPVSRSAYSPDYAGCASTVDSGHAFLAAWRRIRDSVGPDTNYEIRNTGYALRRLTSEEVEAK